MTNPLDELSKPVKVENTRLATVFWLNARDSKKGRLFIPAYDFRFPFKFEVKYTYVSKIMEKNNVSGKHYHKRKEEIIIPLKGSFDFHLEDINTKEKEVISIDGDDNRGIYIRTGIAHSLLSKDEKGILLVLASVNSSLDDEIEYSVDI